MKQEEKYQKVIEYFRSKMPVVTTELNHRNAYELIVAVILSAQCTDRRVNLITPALFEHFPDFKTLAKATVEEIFQFIKSCSYPNNKAKHLKAMAEMVVNEFGGQLPEDPEILQQLPGVGRKTANVLASVLHRKPVIAVDTHVFRVSKRIGLVKNAKTPLSCEKQLMLYFPPEVLADAHHWLILHGRYVCMARKPNCMACGLTQICDYFQEQKSKDKLQ
ncbi:MAG: endonuclease III [Bacteroidales bacterium]|nr:endonuclease III [Bacteroidales bacterium]